MKYFLFGTVLLFGVIATVGWMKREKPKTAPTPVQEIALGTKAAPVAIVVPKPSKKEQKEAASQVPAVDKIGLLFALDGTALPIVETVSFTSRVPWLKDRPAWIADYATHYETSRHFIARSLNKKIDYLTQKVNPGDRFNVFRKDKDVKFNLVVDMSTCRMWFYYLDKDEKVLLKTYKVGLGKSNSASTSGYLTPLGKYELGEKIASYKPGVISYFQEQKTEMIRVFGTRWLPFDKKIEGNNVEIVKGLGLHGLPWVEGPNGALVEDRSTIGKYQSDGCIRLAQEDIEEIYAIVASKPTFIEIVKEYKQ